MKIKIFGKLTDIFNGSEYDIPSEGITSIEKLKCKLAEEFPILKETTYLVAVDGSKAEDTHLVSNASEIALLPPYSGG